MKYLSVCSGIEAATSAWHPLKWTPVGFAEIEPFPSAVLAHHYGSNMPGEPLSLNGVPNYGDFTTIIDKPPECNLLVGGCPCQSFSIAGLRNSLDDDRGNLTLQFIRLAHALQDTYGNTFRWAVYENVPGILSTKDNAFGCFLSGLVGGDIPLTAPQDGGWPSAGMVAGPRARVAWRVLDAQHFGLAQRRKRVFVVAGFADGADPATVLFERLGMSGDIEAGGQEREGIAGTLSARTKGGGALGTDFDLAGGLQPFDMQAIGEYGDGSTASTASTASTVKARDYKDATDLVAHTLTGNGFDASEDGTLEARTQVQAVAFHLRGREGGAMPEISGDIVSALTAADGGSSRDYIAFDTTQITSPQNSSNPQAGDPCHPLAAGAHAPAIAFDTKAGGDTNFAVGNVAGTLRGDGCGGGHAGVQTQSCVRRLTPTECERLQGFPDGHTMIPWRGKPAEQCPDRPRYRALGNSMAVPVMAWIGRRIDAVERGIAP